MGRPSELDEFALLGWEGVWIGLFYNLRNGAAEVRQKKWGSSGILIKAKPENEKVFIASDDQIREESGKETIYTTLVGEKTNVLRQPGIIESQQHMESWQKKAEEAEQKFERIAMGFEPRIEIIPGKPPERDIWEALKRARTAAEVRMACSRSKIWLISRIDFPDGGFMDWSWSPIPMALYRQAELFCKAKLDPRYPSRDDRETGDYRRIEYLGRVMAGLSVDKPISPSYSVEILRKMKHDKACLCWRCQHQLAPRYRRSVVDFLRDGSFENAYPLRDDS